MSLWRKNQQSIDSGEFGDLGFGVCGPNRVPHEDTTPFCVFLVGGVKFEVGFWAPFGFFGIVLLPKFGRWISVKDPMEMDT